MRFLSAALFLFICSGLFAQPSERRLTREEYIEKYKDDAVREMLLHGVPASITLAQGMLESGNGNSPLAKYANNHFGIKCHEDWKGATFTMDDDAKDECFRKYPTVFDSYSDHSLFLKSRRWYNSLFELKITDYKGWAYGLKKAGYATEPKYAGMLIELIEKHKLYELDKLKSVPNLSRIEKTPEAKPEFKPHRHSVYFINKRKHVFVQPGDSYEFIAKEFELDQDELFKFNDLSREKPLKLKDGAILFIQPKRKKSEVKTHTVKAGETMHSISQKYGIKLKKLYDRNLMDPGKEPAPGDVLQLNKTK